MGAGVWQLILTVITVVSVTMTVAIGIDGLRQGFYYNKKITERGRKARVWLIALGFVTLLSAFAAQQVSDAKEKEEAETRQGQFRSQMESLGRLQESLSESIENVRRVQGTLNVSLDRQERLASATAENLRQGRQLQLQQNRNTATVIRSISDETSRITGSDLVATVTPLCSGEQMYEDWGLVPQHIEIVVNGGSGWFALEAIDNNPQRLESYSGRQFRNFDVSLGRFETFPPWRRAHATIIVRAIDFAAFDAAGNALAPFSQEEIRGLLREAQARGARSCSVSVSLQARRWTLFRFFANLVEVRPGDFQGLIEDARLRPQTIDEGM